MGAMPLLASVAKTSRSVLSTKLVPFINAFFLDWESKQLTVYPITVGSNSTTNHSQTESLIILKISNLMSDWHPTRTIGVTGA